MFYNVFGCRNFDQLIPDAPELILNYLEGEQDASCKRNAFMMLTHVDRVSVCCVCTCICMHMYMYIVSACIFSYMCPCGCTWPLY